MSAPTWDDVARRFADDIEQPVDHPSVTDAVDALRATKLSPALVLDAWDRVATELLP